MGARQYFTPLQYSVLLISNTLTLLKVEDIEDPREPNITTDKPVETASTKVGTRDVWRNLINLYGSLNDGVSQIRLSNNNNITEVVGTVSYHPTDDSLLIFNADVDTYPTNTLSNINAIIDPRRVTVDTSITNPSSGTRYLILHDIGSHLTPAGLDPIAWRGTDGVPLVAHANDIIQWNGSHWSVIFDSRSETNVQYVSNLNTGTQYKWNLDQWVKSWEGEYKAGLWTLVI
jgi:hypothetical protein